MALAVRTESMHTARRKYLIQFQYDRQRRQPIMISSDYAYMKENLKSGPLCIVATTRRRLGSRGRARA